jgi:hypothetical protein
MLRRDLPRIHETNHFSSRILARCPSSEGLEVPVELGLGTAQKKRTNVLSASTEKSSNKKSKKSSGRDNSPVLKLLIQELSTDISEDDLSLQFVPSASGTSSASIDFHKLYDERTLARKRPRS